jgi:peptidoglycan/LPS O-acetylase OafA/YrhL
MADEGPAGEGGPNCGQDPERPSPGSADYSDVSMTVTDNPSTRHFTALDGIRAFAALSVVVFHAATGIGFGKSIDSASQSLGARLLLNLGNFGVAVFFVLSGFLLFREFVGQLLFNRPRKRLPLYFAKRFLRIYPAYWLALLGYVVVVGAKTINGGSFGNFLLIERYFDSQHLVVGLGVAWTLTVEVAFYISLPIFTGVLWLVCRRLGSARARLAVVLGSLVVISMVNYWWLGLVSPSGIRGLQFEQTLPGLLFWFALGMSISVALEWRESGRGLPAPIVGFADRTWACWLCAASFYAAIALTESVDVYQSATSGQLLVKLTFQGLAAFFVVLPAALGTGRGWGISILENTRVIWLGIVSYGIYLWHMVVMKQILIWYKPASSFVGLVTLLAIVLPPTILIAWLSHRYLEMPALSLANYFKGDRRSSPQAGTPSERNHDVVRN